VCLYAVVVMIGFYFLALYYNAGLQRTFGLVHSVS
jgi:hypothetical protein